MQRRARIGLNTWLQIAIFNRAETAAGKLPRVKLGSIFIESVGRVVYGGGKRREIFFRRVDVSVVRKMSRASVKVIPYTRCEINQGLVE